MPSRYGPGVLPEPNVSFANALSGLAGGFDYGTQLMDRRRQRQQQDEDRARAARERMAADLERPGAVSEESFLRSPDAMRDVAALPAGVGNASTRFQGDHLPLTFTPEASRRYFQTATGPVVDRKAALADQYASALARTVPTYVHSGYDSPQAMEEGKVRIALGSNPQRPAQAENIRAKTGKLEGAAGDERTIAAEARRTHPRWAHLPDHEVAVLYDYEQKSGITEGRQTRVAGTRAATSPAREHWQLQDWEREQAGSQQDLQNLDRQPEAGYRPGGSYPQGTSAQSVGRWRQRRAAAATRFANSQAALKALRAGQPVPPEILGGPAGGPGPGAGGGTRRTLPPLPPIPPN